MADEDGNPSVRAGEFPVKTFLDSRLEDLEDTIPKRRLSAGTRSYWKAITTATLASASGSQGASVTPSSVERSKLADSELLSMSSSGTEGKATRVPGGGPLSSAESLRSLATICPSLCRAGQPKRARAQPFRSGRDRRKRGLIGQDGRLVRQGRAPRNSASAPRIDGSMSVLVREKHDGRLVDQKIPVHHRRIVTIP